MKRKHLVLLTSGFPYGCNEPFLESEIGHLCEHFYAVTIIAGSDPNATVRALPENATMVSHVTRRSVRYSPRVWGLSILHYLHDAIYSLVYYKVRPRRSSLYQMLEHWDDALPLSEEIDQVIQQSSFSADETVVYSYWLSSLAVSAARIKQRYPSLKVVSRAHGWDLYFERIQSHYLPLRPFLLSQLDGVYPVSGHGATYLDTKLGRRFSNKIEVRYLAVNPPISISRQITERGSAIRIVSCARMVALKRIELIVDALAILNNQSDLPLIEWCHLGDGPEEPKITKRVEGMLSAQGCVTVKLLGNLTNTQVLDFYANHAVDLFLSTSQWEGLPVSMMEAASYSIPVIGTDVGGVSEIVLDGFLLSANPEPAEIANAIRCYLLMPPADREALSRRSKNVWEQKFNAQTVFSDWAQELSEN